jgi:hypothetical protein
MTEECGNQVLNPSVAAAKAKSPPICEMGGLSARGSPRAFQRD